MYQKIHNIQLFLSRAFEIHLLEEFQSLLYYRVSSKVAGMSSPSRNLVSSGPDNVLDNLLLDHVGLPHVLVLTVPLVNLLGWMGKGDHSRYLATLLLKIRVN